MENQFHREQLFPVSSNGIVIWNKNTQSSSIDNAVTDNECGIVISRNIEIFHRKHEKILNVFIIFINLNNYIISTNWNKQSKVILK